MKSEKRNKVLQFIESVEQCLQSIEEDEKREINYRFFENKKNIKVPFEERRDSKTSFVFRRPRDVQIVGSFSTDTYLKRDVTVDLLVTISKKCFHERDYLNQKYFQKCALYIAFIAIHLRKCFGKSIQLRYSHFNGIQLKPVLLLSNSNLSFCSFRILVRGETSCFKLSRFSPSTNNVRFNWFYGKEGEDVCTPYYNSILLQDLNLFSNHEYLVNGIENSSELKEVIVTLKVWLRQRGFKGSQAFIFSMFALYLIKEKKISKHMNCFTLFRNILFHFSVSNWENEAISLCSETPIDVEDFLKSHDIVFLDYSGYLNLCFNMPAHIYRSLKHEATLTVKYLDKSSVNSFEVFLTKPVLFNEKFDAIVLIRNGAFSDRMISHMEVEDRFLDYSGDIIKACVPPLINLINYGWGHRFILIQEESTASVEWNLNENCPSFTEISKFIKLGFLFNGDHILDIVDRGPIADKPEAEDFKLYWEELSELRRFQDGDVCEAVYWKSTNINERRHIFVTALKYILQKKARISPNRLSFPGINVETLLHLNRVKFPGNQNAYATGEEALYAAVATFDSLSKKLRKLEFQLEISRIQGISPIFRGAEVFPAMSGFIRYRKNEAFEIAKDKLRFVVEHDFIPYLIEPLEVILHFETSGKWPDELGALRSLKAAIHLELAKQLRNSFGVICKPTPEYVDIYYEGYIFRLIASSYKELTLLRTVKNEDGVLCKVDSQEADQLETRIDILPKLTSALHALHVKNMSYNVACRLAKRWISSQLFSEHLNDVVIELIMAHVYINHFPYSVPNSAVTGFIRFLSLIATHDWKGSPLIVNLNEELTPQKIEEIENKFKSERSKLPAMFIVSPYDKHPSMWTFDNPCAPVLKRLVILATTSSKILIEQLNSRGEDHLVIFRPPMEVFDVLIHLDSEKIANFHLEKESQNKKVIEIKPFDPNLRKLFMPVVDFNPVGRFVAHLRQAYSEIALFFYDKFGGNVIGVIWKPVAFEMRSDYNFFNFCKLAEVSSNDGSFRFEVNFEAILEDFRILGKGIVNDIQIRSTMNTMN